MTRRSLSRRGFLARVGVLAATTGLSTGVVRAQDAAPPAGRAPMRFGFTAPQGASYREIMRLWQDGDFLGFDTAFVYDHFMAMLPGPPEAERCFEAWSLLSALAARTERIRLGVLVSGNTYRHPAVVAKMAATIDHVSGGRVILGLGAAWLEREHVAYGIAFHTAGERARRLVEAVEVIRQLLTQERSTFDGKYYTLKDAPCEPKPLQKPHPPILIGGIGSKRVQPLAARRAQIWHFIARGNDLAEATRLCASFDALCQRVGRDPAEVEKATSVEAPATAAAARELRGRIRTLMDAGVRHVILAPPRANGLATLHRFAKEVMPAFRARRA